MDDDLNVPRALAAIHEHVRTGNAALDEGDLQTAGTMAHQVRLMTDILGVNPLDERWAPANASAEASALDALVQSMIAQRADARAAKDWVAADRVRDAIAVAGITLEDTSSGTHWNLSGSQPATKE